jgi:DNA invertase Pin-like site-specific DNA recombinase
VIKRLPPRDKIFHRQHTDIAEVSLTRGQVNAVRTAFKAGITPTRIARQFGIFQSNVRKALAADEPKR